MRSVSLALLPVLAVAAEHGELPLRVAAAGTTAEAMPVLAIGGGMVDGVTRREQGSRSEQWLPDLARDDISAGAARLFALGAPRAKRPLQVVASLRLPWRPVSITRHDRTFTIVGDAVRLDERLAAPEVEEPRGSAADSFRVFALSLGVLDPGDYRVALDVAVRARPAGQRTLTQRARISGTLPFTVDAREASDERLAAVRLDQATEEAVPEMDGAYAWRIPRSLLLYDGGGRAEQGLIGVGVPEGGSHDAAPRVRAPISDDIPMAVVVGPVLDSGEWLQLREVEEFLGNTIITVAVWRDDGGRDKNVPHRDALVVPVGDGGDRPPQVAVRWLNLRAPTPECLYQQEQAEAGPGAPPVRAR